MIGILGATFSGNKGAAAMLQSILKNIEMKRPSPEFNVFSVYPSEDISQNTYETVRIINAKPEKMIFIAFPLAFLYFIFHWIYQLKKVLLKNEILKAFDECDIVVDAAGITFVDSRGFIMNTYNFICIAIPIFLGKKVIKYSQAMGPIKKPWNKLLAKIILPKVDTICARGNITFDHLKQLNLENVVLCADGAFSMLDNSSAIDFVENIIKNDNFYRNKFITLSISSVVNNYCKKNNIDYITFMGKFIDYLCDKGYGVLIVANAARKGKVKPKNNDLIVCQEVYQMVSDKNKCRWYNEEYTPEIIREFIGRSKILVASRFHAMIGALHKGVPVLLIGWSHKYKEVLEMFDVGEYATDYKKLSLNDLINQFEQLENQYEMVKDNIEKNLPKVMESSYKNIELILDKLEAK